MEQIPAPLKGKVAVVTGGGRGLGSAIAIKLAEQGCSHLAISYSTNRTKADETLATIHKISPNIKTHAFSASVLEENFGAHIVDETLSGLGVDHVDIVVANATNSEGDKVTPASKLSRQEWDDTMTGNAFSSLDLARNAVLKMPRGGRIVMISSAAAKAPTGEYVIAYAAAKAALECVSKNLAVAWGPEYGITVNSVSVGATKTDGLQKSLDAFGPEFESMTKDLSMLKRHAEASEVASIVAFIASPDASWVIGAAIPANGGALSTLQG
ncbi:hypothetical protein M409DRAFT_24668 [Zasmidium cellare ATCC 36951]|uniref:Ketoreductase (KR) domain-containing protein n=1 Tax=Zasmidium cellare ATCC 36951 TaxID=1080233 RepID=A0A6A6CDG3_ZASCE|nr:uncharacterized protein M409DRAFT_24668 [Zasmidium cellare ATCC 36951]KAF2164763.1 hypothetical protein M409DRAFT_24668 [Zasmidium cellare ATCC 36951]